jgi:hypothetical protein
MLDIAPLAAADPAIPSVGIFWRINNTLLVDRSELARAESYADRLTHPEGHYERWEAWRALGARRLRELGYPSEITSTEYEEWPRGRIVQDTKTGCFFVYTDRRLQTRETISVIKAAFGLHGMESTIMSDPHYR